jgi:histidine triad (HIT) family protein
MHCIFCQIATRSLSAFLVYEDAACLAFLDTRPLFPGHCLLIPRVHCATLADLPPEGVGGLFLAVQKLAKAVESALEAEGSFVAVNNRISQSVPHLHVHVVPRRKKDGLKGFFWPRTSYRNEEEMGEIQAKIVGVLADQT